MNTQTTGEGGRIALVGAAGSYKQTPWKDPDLRIWGLGMHAACLPRKSRLFEMHDRSIWGDYLHQPDTPYARKLSGHGVPVVMREEHDDIPHSERFPFERVVERFGDFALNWFEGGYYVSSPSYMIAYALLENAAEIHLYGLHMCSSQEYGYQKPNMEFWCGVAMGMGVKVWTHQASPLLRARHLYGSREWFDAGADTSQRARFRQGMTHGTAMAY